MQNNKKNKTSLRSFKMKSVTQPIPQNSSVTSLAGNSLNNTSNLTMIFPSCPAENLQCGGPAYIINSDLLTMLYVDKISLDNSSVIKNNITQFEFGFSNSTFGITYNKQKSEITYINTDNGTYGWEIFDVTENAGILNSMLESIQKGLLITQIEYSASDLNRFYILSPNVDFK